MAEAVLFDIAKEILKQLSCQAFTRALQEIGVWWNVKDELKKLEKTVSTIQAVLLDAEEQHALNHEVKDWVGKLRSALYDADDLLDDFATEVMRQQQVPGNKMIKKVRRFASHSNQLAYGYKMGCKVKAIREELDAISADRQKFHFVEHNFEAPFLTKRRDTHSFVAQENVIGRDEDKVSIIERLLDSNVEDKVSVIPIVGLGGLGKTTLARFVFNDVAVTNHFEMKLWVCVSDDFTLQGILKKAMHFDANGLEKLQNDFRKMIEGKKYLLVLDDVWSDDLKKRLELHELLMAGAPGSRIVVTTRSKVVAKITSKVEPHELKGLGENDSWSLFKKVVLRGKELKNQDTREIGVEIVKKCCGVPLAIMTIAGLMYSRNPETEWPSFLKNEISKLPQKENDILPVLRLSYNHLPSALKHCFAYCKLFPKDYEIDVITLVQLWVAQGFIRSSAPIECLEDVGFQYFKDLSERSFFLEVKEDEIGNVISCKMHDLMHDLATLVGGEETAISNSHGVHINERSRHISFDFAGDVESFDPILLSLLPAKKVRSLLVVSRRQFSFDVQACDKIASNLKCLLVLDLRYSSMKRVPNSIIKLKHLRYLDLSSNTDIEILPDSVTQLINLQVIKLHHCTSLKELPKDINKLVHLKHLDCEQCLNLTHMPRGLGQLTSIQRLSCFTLPELKDSCASKHAGGLEELKELNNLRGSLCIERLRYISEYVAANPKEKQLLQTLCLCWDSDASIDTRSLDDDFNKMSLESFSLPPKLKQLTVLQYPFEWFPSWPFPLANIVTIELRDWRRCKVLPPLDQTPSLKELFIVFCSKLEYIEFEKGPAFFPSLQRLKLSCCKDLKGWRKKGEHNDDIAATTTAARLPHFHSLSELQIIVCDEMTWESFPPPPKLNKLTVNKYKGESFPSWHSLLTNIVEIDLKGWKRCKHLPPLDHFPFLQRLAIEKFDELEYIEFGSGPNLFPSLKTLKLTECYNLKEWRMKEGDKTTMAELPYFHSLSDLRIDYCPHLNLESLPIPVKLEEELYLYTYEGSCFPSSWPSFLTNVTVIGLIRWNRCKHLPPLDQMPSLQTLSLCDFDDLEYIQIRDGPTFFPSLKTLGLYNCPNLKGWLKTGDDNKAMAELLPQVRCLSDLTISNCPNLILMPLVHSFSNLNELWIEKIKNLESLPADWLQNLTCLQTLYIKDLGSIACVPQEMRCLTSLQKLSISKCPQLRERCGSNKSVDWPYIAHIPYIEIEWQKVQEEGRYLGDALSDPDPCVVM